MYTHTYTYMYPHTHIYMYMCVCLHEYTHIGTDLLGYKGGPWPPQKKNCPENLVKITFFIHITQKNYTFVLKNYTFGPPKYFFFVIS